MKCSVGRTILCRACFPFVSFIQGTQSCNIFALALIPNGCLRGQCSQLVEGIAPGVMAGAKVQY